MNLGIETRIFVRHIVVSPQISTACLSVDRCAIYFICMTIGISPVVEIGPFFGFPQTPYSCYGGILQPTQGGVPPGIAIVKGRRIVFRNLSV